MRQAFASSNRATLGSIAGLTGATLK